MLLENILILIALVGGFFFVGIPFFRFVRAFLPVKKRNPLQEAKERLEQARLEVEAAKLNKQTEKLYDHIYQDALGEQDAEDEVNDTTTQERK